MVKHHDVVGRYVTIEVDECEYKVFYLQNGKGIPLICQHTAGCHNHQWRGLLEDPEITKNYNVIAYDLQAIMLRWPSNNPVEILFVKSIVLRGYAESKTINAPVSILLQRASPCVVETAPKAQAKTTWWHNVVDHWIDVLVSPQSTGGHAHLVL